MAYAAMIPSLSRTVLLRGSHARTIKLARWRALCFSTTTTTDKNNINDDGDNQIYLKSYRSSGVGEASKVTITTDTGHIITTDLPQKMGGSDSAPQPVETLIAAWMGCTQATALFVGRHMMGLPDDRKRGGGGRRRRVSIQKLEFENIQAYRDERGAVELPINKTPVVESRLRRITGIIRVFSRSSGGEDNGNGDGFSLEQMELLKEQTEIRCPLANMIIASGCSIDVEWVDASLEVDGAEPV